MESPEISAVRPAPHHSGCCSYVVTREVRAGALDLRTGDVVMGEPVMVTEPCNVPLFGKYRGLGLCREHALPRASAEV